MGNSLLSGYIYLVDCGKQSNGKFMFKIGETAHPNKRIENYKDYKMIRLYYFNRNHKVIEKDLIEKFKESFGDPCGG
jgi:hypothetical protein